MGIISEGSNETSVRFHIIDPLMRRLGYPDDERVYIEFEEKLEYPYVHIGHRSKKDLPLGYPDYRAGLKGRRGSFIVEAKAAKVGLGKHDVEQAHSYAAHAQVGANYFVLCDGLQFVIYETLSGPEKAPLVEMQVSEFERRFHEIESVLSPDSLAKNCHIEHDKNLKLCDGFGSFVEVKSGTYEMRNWALRYFISGNDVSDFLRANVPEIASVDQQLQEMHDNFELRVSEGFAKRDEEGRLKAHVVFAGATKGNAAGMRLLGIQSMTFESDAEFLSRKPDEPTVFESSTDFSYGQGTMLPQFMGGAQVASVNMIGSIFITARMHIAGSTLRGEYGGFSTYQIIIPDFGPMTMELDIAGDFSLKLLS